MSVVLSAVVCCLLVSSARLFPVRSAVEIVLQPSEPVLAFKNEKALVVSCAVLAHFFLNDEVLEFTLLLTVLPELVCICRIVDGETPPLCSCFSACCAHSFIRGKKVLRFQKKDCALFK